MKAMNVLAAVLVLIGALNWGLVGVLNFNLVAALFGQSLIASIVYTLVGLAGLFLATQWASMRRLTAVTA
jgi:uncharacterized protein